MERFQLGIRHVLGGHFFPWGSYWTIQGPVLLCKGNTTTNRTSTTMYSG